MIKTFTTLLLIVISFSLYSQKGKDGDYTISGTETINTFTTLINTVNAGDISIEVGNASMTGGSFSGPLAEGDLILLYQVQGVDVDVNEWTHIFYGGYTVQESWWDTYENSYLEYGSITDYKNAGIYEYAEVKSVSGNEVTLVCALKNDFIVSSFDPDWHQEKANEKVQVVRVPRFKSLTVPFGSTLTTLAWEGSRGGVLAVEVEEDLVVEGSINVDGIGFRGGKTTGDGTVANGPGSITNINDRGLLGSPNPLEGSEKGEGIYGNFIDYDSIFSRHCYGSIANGGGGANYHNAGGGGGSNVGIGAYYGYGVVDRGPGNSYDPAWNMEDPNMINLPSSGGGRGGYSHVESSKNPLTDPPHNSSWNGDYHRISGGVGGHTLTYSSDRVFMGGGGGAGHQNDDAGGNGGNGGGAIFMNVYGTITGSGVISANGAAGENSEGPTPNTTQPNLVTGNDGAGGAGAGGAVIINNIHPIPSSMFIEVKGGKGGNQVLQKGWLVTKNQASGPGGGGAGGLVAYSVGAPSIDVSGGAGGTTDSSIMTKFKPNGATAGASGMGPQIIQTIDLVVENDTICSGTSTTISVTNVGDLPYDISNVNWYDNYGDDTPITTGATFTTPVLTSDKTYYIGDCNVTYLRIPVQVIVTPSPEIQGTPTIVHESCDGNDGAISGLTISGGTAPYTYEWNGNSSPSIDLTNVEAGSYTLVVTDDIGCSDEAGPFVINDAPVLTLDDSNVSIVDESCDGNDGAISGITISGGSAPFSYEWNGNASANIDLANVVAGAYTLTITDANNCSTTSGPHIISNASGITFDISNVVITNESCDGNDGSILGINVSGGTAPFSFEWNGISSTNENLLNASSDDYTLTVVDANNCTASAGPFTIGIASGITIDASNALITDESCDENDGSITGLIINGGTAPFTYEWNGVSTADEDLIDVAADSYTLTITDANNCVETSGPHVINAAQSISLDDTNIVITDESCDGNDGAISGIVVSSGTAPFTYEWNGVSSSDADLSNVSADSYTLTVIDANNCVATSGPHDVEMVSGVTIDASSVSITDESCDGNDGEILGITITGGAAPFSFEWNGVSSIDADLTNASAGSYTLTVTDANNCTSTSGPHEIDLATGITIDADGISIVNESCDGNDGSITGLVINGGTAPLTYEWNGNTSVSEDLLDVVAGSYTLIVTDANNCSATSGPHEIALATGITVEESGITIVDESCDGNDGSITGLIINGGTAPFAYEWNGVSTLDADLSNAIAGSYVLTVTDANNCAVTSGPHTINIAPAVTLNAVNVVIVDESCDGNDGSITGIVVSGGTAPYTFEWNGVSSADENLSNASAGSYTLTITDDNNCVATSGPHNIGSTSGVIIDDSNISITLESCDGNDGAITGIVISGGVGPYSYEWNGVSSSDFELNGVIAGSYTLTVIDGNNCTTTSGPYTVGSLSGAVIDISNISIVDEGCDGDDGSISGIVISGGTAPYTFSWDNSSETTLDLSNLNAGAYTLTVTDANNCVSTSGPHVVDAPDFPFIDILTPNTVIIEGESVAINVDVEPANSTLIWTPEEGLSCTDCSDPIATPEESTWYVITAISPDGCVSVDSIYIGVEQEIICGDILIPDIFSPNGDGLNDELCVLGNCIASMELMIYNRWGETVFQSNNVNHCWDGKHRDKDVNTGVFIYSLKGIKTDGTPFEKTGNVNLIR